MPRRRRDLAEATPAPERQRLDKWLVYARFVKTRGVADETIAAGRVRLNGARVGKPDKEIGAGDVLTLALPHGTLVVRVIDVAERRGPAFEARDLYEEIA